VLSSLPLSSYRLLLCCHAAAVLHFATVLLPCCCTLLCCRAAAVLHFAAVLLPCCCTLLCCPLLLCCCRATALSFVLHLPCASVALLALYLKAMMMSLPPILHLPLGQIWCYCTLFGPL